jgi:hypothetical protein
MEIKEIKKLKKNLHRFVCENCDFKCYMKCDWDKHIMRPKHINAVSGNNMETKKLKKTYTCECGKSFLSNSGLWKHKKSCVEPEEPLANNDFDNPENLIKYLMKENAEFKQLLIDQNKQMMAQNNNMMSQNDRIIELSKNVGNNNNSNNTNSFNLNMYLNETCKDALNIMDFVNQLKIGLKELEETGRLGFANGISKIFIDGLKQIDINNRPVHCSDSKRETLYIKSNNEWNKEDGERKILTSALKHVANKNIKQISEWTKVHPDYNDSDSKDNDRFLQIVSEAMSGSTQDETIKNYNKIIKNIAKETVIEKCCD